MKRWFSGLLAFLLLFSLVLPNLSKAHASVTTAVLDSKLVKALESATEPLQVIVSFDGQGAPTKGNLDLLKSLGIAKGITMKALPMAGIVATKDQINKLAASPGVKSIYLNRKLEYYNADATNITGVDKARTDSAMQKANGGLPLTGKGVGVVINDSGVDGTHKDLQFGTHVVQNVMASLNLNSLEPSLLPITYVENVPNTDTNSGHGTHVAGIVGGTGAASNGKYEGVAPGASLIGYGSGAALLVLDGIGGFDYAITHQSQYNIRVITNSWGSSGDFDPNDPINLASKAAYDRGITVLFAAGNEGPGENTHNPYAKAPWVISVAAGEKDGSLADFSSRGTKGVGGTFELDGRTWTWKDEPSITAPGVDIISTRAVGPVSSLAATDDTAMIEPAYLPYYTVMSGTSMATPHVAGIAALLLEAKPTLTPDEIKKVLQDTATNMPGYETWEVGSGYVNAYAALDAVLFGSTYGKTVNANQTFNSNAASSVERSPFQVDYNPLLSMSNNYSFDVPDGVSQLTARIDAYGLLGQTGNPVNLILTAPDGTEYSSGISLLFTLYPDRTATVNSPKAGTWQVKIDGLHYNTANPVGVGLPETIQGTISVAKVNGFSGLNDIASSPAASAIQMAVSERLVDGYADGSFKPQQNLIRKDLARFLVMGAGIRQSQAPALKDVQSADVPFVKAVTAKGSAIRDGLQTQGGVMLLDSAGNFNPNGEVSRAELAYTLVQALGLEKQAKDFSGDTVTVLYKDERIPLKDNASIPASLKGYVQTALDLNILNATFAVKQGPYDLVPTVEASFDPAKKVTRGDYAAAVTRYFQAWLQ
ncbi:S8 family serine peptidase [Paenibacillus sp. BSR1-1]|uniref:S8 family serine peptidase n=1 Tax=Paenibacillus sp. BSR1-1 TaxID=3020845 RepID=UPI0025B0CF84|nr:S8 family serine peptidase [Paenibacillus sp. BSR1-1]MDN3017753.1 S8 family serine peptidase [Paenibacillus sp. BSR1-1]